MNPSLAPGITILGRLYQHSSSVVCTLVSYWKSDGTNYHTLWLRFSIEACRRYSNFFIELDPFKFQSFRIYQGACTWYTLAKHLGRGTLWDRLEATFLIGFNDVASPPDKQVCHDLPDPHGVP